MVSNPSVFKVRRYAPSLRRISVTGALQHLEEYYNGSGINSKELAFRPVFTVAEPRS
jgi:hypothetical protein